MLCASYKETRITLMCHTNAAIAIDVPGDEGECVAVIKMLWGNKSQAFSRSYPVIVEEVICKIAGTMDAEDRLHAILS